MGNYLLSASIFEMFFVNKLLSNKFQIMNDKMVLVTAGVSFVVKTNGEDEDLDSLITSAANAAASELNGVSVSLPNGSGSGSNSGSADGKVGAGGLGSNGSATAAIMEDINCDAIGGVTSIGKLMEELTRSVGNGSYMEDENFAIEVRFSTKLRKFMRFQIPQSFRDHYRFLTTCGFFNRRYCVQRCIGIKRK